MHELNQEADPQRTPFELVHRGILRNLYEGRFAPGQRLAAPDLMREFGVGRGTIREILQRLASTGVVTITPNKGAYIRRLSRTGVISLLDVVEVLLGLAARGAATASSALKTDLQQRLLEMQEIKVDFDFNRFLAAREEYYRLLVASQGNFELQRVFPAAQVQLMRLQLRPFDRAADAVDMADYRDLHNAIMAGNADLAEQAGREHVRRTRDKVLMLPDRAF